MLLLAVTIGLGAASGARADFVVQMCGGAPAPPWVAIGGGSAFPEADDHCAAGGGYWFDVAAPGVMTYNTADSAGVQAPAGETLTHITATFHSQDAESSGSLAFLRWGDSTGAMFFDREIGDDNAGTSVDAALPDVSSVFVNVYCSYSKGPVNCTFPSPFAIVSVETLELTVHDTGTPTVQSLGGGLGSGTVSGQQAVLYQASDAGSGVRLVTVSLGPTVVGLVAPACQSWSLQPCPASSSGTITADTRRVPDGTYPVILTAYDASGDAAPRQIGLVTVRNHAGTVSVPHSRRRGRVHTAITLRWTWSARRTVLDWVHIGRLPPGATLVLSCAGRGCPFRRRTARGAGIARLLHRLRGRRFHAGDRLTVALGASGQRSERGVLVIRSDARPAVR
jgi:hypothetical protein